ncbi:hypothetical protein [Bacillus pumilus]|uniref:hypothetical protein n=1 Tax=Bacillus pumilus TaxID=1408 RepID=UPI001C92EAD5|nr:hypothetical protein [Bacillus pumilus]
MGDEKEELECSYSVVEMEREGGIVSGVKKEEDGRGIVMGVLNGFLRRERGG